MDASNETRLLICCARTEVSPAITKQIQAIVQHPIDWQELIDQATYHGILPLLYKNLSATCLESIPQPIFAYLHHNFHCNALNNLNLSIELLKILKTLESHDITAIPFKGPMLATIAYGDVALRTFHDLDIWVQWQDYSKPRTLLVDQGYHPDSSANYFLGDAQAIASYEDFGEYPLEQSYRRISLDVHGRLLSIGSFPIASDFSPFWSRSRPLSFLDQTVLTFRAEDLLLYLCVNGTRDCWMYFKAICDIAALVHRHPNLDWDDLLEQSERLGIRRMLWLGLYLAAQTLDLVIPPKVAQLLQSDPKVKKLADPIICSILSNEDSPNATGWKKLSFHLTAIEHLSHQILFCHGLSVRAIRLLLRPNLSDQALISLPRFLYFLYPILRPIRLIRDHGFSIFNLLVS